MIIWESTCHAIQNDGPPETTQHHGTSRAACHWLHLSHAAMIEPRKTTFPNVNAYVSLSLLVIIRHHLSISFLLIAAPIDNVHDFWFRSNAHAHTYIHRSVPSEASLLWLPARPLKVTGSSLSPSCKGLKIRLYSSCSSYATASKKELIQFMLSCCCCCCCCWGKTPFLLHVF